MCVDDRQNPTVCPSQDSFSWCFNCKTFFTSASAMSAPHTHAQFMHLLKSRHFLSSPLYGRRRDKSGWSWKVSSFRINKANNILNTHNHSFKHWSLNVSDYLQLWSNLQCTEKTKAHFLLIALIVCSVICVRCVASSDPSKHRLILELLGFWFIISRKQFGLSSLHE